MKCLFIQVDGTEKIYDMPVYGTSEAGQPLPPEEWQVGCFPKGTVSFKAWCELPEEDRTVTDKRFRVSARTAHELLPIYTEISS